MQFVCFPPKNVRECVLGNGVPYRHSKGGDVSVRRCHFVGVCMGMSVGKKSLCGEKRIGGIEIHSHYQTGRF
jgi:hypothetical protein